MYNIKPILKERGYNLSKLAKKLDMSFQRFDHHIKKKDDLSYNFVRDISNVLNLSIDEFIDSVKCRTQKKPAETNNNKDLMIIKNEINKLKKQKENSLVSKDINDEIKNLEEVYDIIKSIK